MINTVQSCFKLCLCGAYEIVFVEFVVETPLTVADVVDCFGNETVSIVWVQIIVEVVDGAWLFLPFCIFDVIEQILSDFKTIYWQYAYFRLLHLDLDHQSAERKHLWIQS